MCNHTDQLWYRRHLKTRAPAREGSPRYQCSTRVDGIPCWDPYPNGWLRVLNVSMKMDIIRGLRMLNSKDIIDVGLDYGNGIHILSGCRGYLTFQSIV